MSSKTSIPHRAFYQQKANAKRRKIAWELTFDEWWTVWTQSGKWGQRGRKHRQYVMSRFNDTGPYHHDNVFIQLAINNVSDGPHKHSDLPMGIAVSRNGRFIAQRYNKGKSKHLGTFDTIEEAVAAYQQVA